MDLKEKIKQTVSCLISNEERIKLYADIFTEIAIDYHNEQLRLLSVVKSVKEKKEPTFYDWIIDNNYKKMWHGIYKKDKKVYLTRELFEKYEKEIEHQL